MKKQKVCALLCVAAMSATSVTPVMAADAALPEEAVAVQSETEAAGEAEAVQEKASEASDEAGEAEAVQEEAPEASEEAGETEAVQKLAPEASEASEEAAGEVQEEEQQTAEGPKDAGTTIQDGWSKDEDGNTCYYKDGVKLTNQVAEIADEDGTVYGYYFENDGALFTNDTRWIAFYDEEQHFHQECICADESGHLKKGWVGFQYYGDDYFIYHDELLEEDGKLYYFDGNGYLVKNQDIAVDDKFYHADGNGVLTVIDVSAKNDWQFIGDYWYYFKDGSVLKDTFETINGSKYHFESDGKMTTGRFLIDGKYYLAEPGGQIVTTRGWYQSKQSGKWYWFDKNGDVAGNDLLTIGGQKYYFDGNGIMQTGVFWANYQEDNHYWVVKTLFANASGTIVTTPGWKSQGGTWYYVKTNGQAASNELIEINGSSYYFNYQGAMQTGLISTYVNDKRHYYIANASGAIVKGSWIKEGLEWYYTDKDGNVCTNKWIGNCYVTSNGTMAVGEKEIDGKTYVFDENGYKQKVIGEQSGWTLADGTWYYYTADGKPYNGWLNHTYYIENGRMMTDATVPSEHNNSANDYYSYVGVDGTVASGWVETLTGYWKYAEKNAATGDLVLVEDDWRKIGNTWYYFDDDTDMVFDTIIEVDGKVSQFAASGAWQGYVSGEGWKQTTSGDWYYVNADGTLNTESKKEIGGLTYYFYYDGIMRKNEAFRDEATGKYFWINANGNIDTKDGWKLGNYGEWYYVENGSLVGEGEKVVSGSVYHFNTNGCMDTGELYENGYYIYGANGGKTEATSGWYSGTVYGRTKWYYFKNGQPYTGFVGSYYIQYGTMITNLLYNGSSEYMFDENGRLFTGGWIYRWGAWYYAGKTGRIYTGEWNIGGRRYIFNRNGEWVK